MTTKEQAADDALKAADKLALEVEDQLRLQEGGTPMSVLALRYKLNTYDKLKGVYDKENKNK